MEVSLKTVRELGVKKIYTYYSRKGLWDNIVSISYVTQGITKKVPSYSFLLWYKTLSDSLPKEYKQLCLYSEPLMDIQDKPTEFAKRKFRNSVQYIFNLVYQAAFVEKESDIDILRDICLAIPFVDKYFSNSRDNEIQKVVGDLTISKREWTQQTKILREFYSTLLSWYYLTSTEMNLNENDITLEVLLESLVVNEEGFKIGVVYEYSNSIVNK